MKTYKIFLAKHRFIIYAGLIFILIVVAVSLAQTNGGKYQSFAVETETLHTPPPERTLKILVDDFSPEFDQSAAPYSFNHLAGDRGALNGSIITSGSGFITATISTENSWGGGWMSLNHPLDEGLPINFSAILPPQIIDDYQSQITGMSIHVANGTPNRVFRVELKDEDELHWTKEMVLDGKYQVLNFDLPTLAEINHLVWILDQAAENDYVVLDRITFTATTQITDTPTAAFVWSYGMLLNNWNPDTGLVRDKARDASGVFDGIQSTGSLAAATAIAEQLGIIKQTDAVDIVNKISETLLSDLPRLHGLWPHWVQTSDNGEIVIVPGTEWSSVDTAIAAVGLLTAQSGLDLDTSSTEQMLQDIAWDDLILRGGISHGYEFSGKRLQYAWDVFGGESWLVQLTYAGQTGQVAPLTYKTPPSANGSGFIDELAWLFIPPPESKDYFGTDWTAYRLSAAENQIQYYQTLAPDTCFVQLGLFGLSAAEAPFISVIPSGNTYQAFGLGGNFAAPNDGSALKTYVVVPHYAGLIASLQPEETIQMWDWLIESGYFTPLTNIESLAFMDNSNCNADSVLWNHTKGSWNLALQTLGWGRYLAERMEQPPVLWQAVNSNSFLQRGYQTLKSK